MKTTSSSPASCPNPHLKFYSGLEPPTFGITGTEMLATSTQMFAFTKQTTSSLWGLLCAVTLPALYSSAAREGRLLKPLAVLAQLRGAGAHTSGTELEALPLLPYCEDLTEQFHDHSLRD